MIQEQFRNQKYVEIEEFQGQQRNNMNYNQKDHCHCPTENSPCGNEGEHRCCLCLKPIKNNWKELLCP